jgi:hypothetical protein
MRRKSAASPIPAGAFKTQPLGNAISTPALIGVALARSDRREALVVVAGGPIVAGTNLGLAAAASVSTGAAAAAGANSFFHRNNSAAATRWRRATAETEFSLTASATIAAFSSRL